MTVRDRLQPVNPPDQMGSDTPGRPAWLSAILSLTQDGFAFLGPDGIVRDCNMEFRRQLGLKAPLHEDTTLLSLFQQPQQDWSSIAGLTLDSAPEPAAFLLRSRDGEQIEIEILSVAERGFAAVLRAQTTTTGARALSEQHVGFVQMARQAGMSAVGTAMAHELNQPLTALLLYLQTLQRLLAQEQGTMETRYSDLAAKSVREAQRAAEIVKRIRELAARKEPVRRMVNLEAVIDEAIELARAGRVRPVDIVQDYSAVGAVRIDAIEIQQVLVNLLSNAFDAVSTGQEGTIIIRTRREGKTAQVSVRDSGNGISPQLVGKLFRPFESTKENGLGIGLSISQAIAHAHGGELTVDPGGRGQGATFTLSLPLGIDAESGADPTQRPAVSAHRRIAGTYTLPERAKP